MKRLQVARSQFLTNRQLYISILFFTMLLAFSTLAFLIGDEVVTDLPKVEAAQNAVTGKWTAQASDKRPGEISLMFQNRSSKDSPTSMGIASSLKELQGLTFEAVSSARTNVNFRIAREAGTFEFEGYFQRGKGTGFWKLTPNQNFISAMRSRGYDNLSEEKLFWATIGNLTLTFAAGLKSIGYERLSFDELLEAALHDVTPEFINSWRSAGFQELSLEDLVGLGTHNVTPEYLNQIKAEGFPKISLEQAIKLKAHDIDRNFMRRVKARGFPNVSLRELVELRIHDIVK